MAARAIGVSVKVLRKRTLTPSKQALILTQAAVDRVKELLEREPSMIGLKVGVKQKGCNGSTYTMEYVAKKEKFDEEVIQDGVRIIVDSKALMSLLGTEVDYEVTKLSSGFVFNNPNVKGTCGCQESFSL